MGEAAVKEPSMEDILSSIRKIISEEGNAPEAEESASMEQVVEPEPAPIIDNTADTATSGNDAAKMAASLAGISETVGTGTPMEQESHVMTEMVEPEVPEQSVWNSVAETTPAEEKNMETAKPIYGNAVSQEPAPSLASIAGKITEQVNMPEALEAESIEVTQEEEVRHVEMAEAIPAPAFEDSQASMEATVQAVVEEEMAFKGALMSPSADGAVSGAFDRLKRSAMDDIDAKTEAILRPMLREWLDENLPNMVERLVREEIERVARGV